MGKKLNDISKANVFDDMSRMTDDEIEKQIADVELKLIQIRDQLDIAKSDAVNGVYSDPVWYRSATYALRVNGFLHQKLVKELGIRNKKKRLNDTKRFESVFIDEARRVLSPEVFHEIFNSTRHIVDNHLESCAEKTNG